MTIAPRAALEGYTAWHNNESLVDNPYARETENYWLWHNAWKDAWWYEFIIWRHSEDKK